MIVDIFSKIDIAAIIGNNISAVLMPVVAGVEFVWLVNMLYREIIINGGTYLLGSIICESYGCIRSNLENIWDIVNALNEIHNFKRKK